MATTTAPSGIPQTSSRLAVSTVVGMVLGVLCLFTLVVSYQFFPRRKPQTSPQIRALAPARAQRRPLFTRIRVYCTTFFRNCLNGQIRSTASEARDPESSHTSTHRPLRSFHLSPDHRRQRDAMRKKFASSLRLNVNLPITTRVVPGSSPSKPRRNYSTLPDGDEDLKGLLKPDTALLSPWSPSEEYYPQTPPPIFTPNAEPGTPPPAYVSSSPLRHTHQQFLHSPTTPTKTVSSARTLSMIASENMSAETRSLIEEVKSVIEYTNEWSREHPAASNSFAVGEDDESETSSIWSLAI